jgi:hypothetical protein
VLHHTECDHDTHAVVACAGCGGELTPRNLRAREADWLREKVSPAAD